MTENGLPLMGELLVPEVSRKGGLKGLQTNMNSSSSSSSRGGGGGLKCGREGSGDDAAAAQAPDALCMHPTLPGRTETEGRRLLVWRPDGWDQQLAGRRFISTGRSLNGVDELDKSDGEMPKSTERTRWGP